MKRVALLHAGALLAGALLAGCSAGSPPGIPPTGVSTPAGVPTPPRSTPADSPPTDLEQPPLAGRVTPGRQDQVATGLTARQLCTGGSRSAELTWHVAARRGDAQVVQLSYFADGFDTGRFETTGSLPPDVDHFTWVTLNPGDQVRHWRVLTRHGAGWMPSEVVTFKGSC